MSIYFPGIEWHFLENPLQCLKCFAFNNFPLTISSLHRKIFPTQIRITQTQTFKAFQSDSFLECICYSFFSSCFYFQFTQKDPFILLQTGIFVIVCLDVDVDVGIIDSTAFEMIIQFLISYDMLLFVVSTMQWKNHMPWK